MLFIQKSEDKEYSQRKKSPKFKECLLKHDRYGA